MELTDQVKSNKVTCLLHMIQLPKNASLKIK